MYVCVCVFCAFVGQDNILYKMHGTYIKKNKCIFNWSLQLTGHLCLKFICVLDVLTNSVLIETQG